MTTAIDYLKSALECLRRQEYADAFDKVGSAITKLSMAANHPEPADDERRWEAALAAMQGFISFSGGENREGYVSLKTDSDMTLSPTGKWLKSGDYWHYSKDGTHEVVTTEEQRLARNAFVMADALIAESKKARP